MTEATDTVDARPSRSALSLKSEADFLADEMQQVRAGTWHFLAELMARAPDQALLDRLRGLDAVDTSQGRIAMGWEMMRRAAESAELEDLADEYFNLFVGLGRGELVPFGSWYLTGFLMEKPLAVLREELKALGIERADGVVESEDHAAALAETMALLIESSEEVPFATQQDFFKAHLDPWMGTFFKDVQNAKHADFYRAVGFFGESVVEFEQELLSMPA